MRTPAPIVPIRLVALDIDGTLIGDDFVIGPRTVDAIRAAMSRGVAVSLVTGRMVSSAMRFATELGLEAPIVGYQGALIREMAGARLRAPRPAPRPHPAGRAMSRVRSCAGPPSTGSIRT